VLLASALVRVACPLRAAPPAPSSEEVFETEVRPVLVRTCFPCHGGKKTSGGLRVDSRAALLRGGDSGPAIAPGRPGSSLLIRALGHDDPDLRMPPSKRLPDGTLRAFASWVASGAPWPEAAVASPSGEFRSQKHWAFEPIRPVEPPPDPSGWSDHPIDRFIAAGHRAAGLQPSPEADRRALIRRATFDLIGLPPTPAEIAAFLADPGPDAFLRVVTRLLASPQYGERWGRHWMDVVRYADTAGDNADYPVPEAARYRDYIIAAFNTDKPFDRFIREQVAGDLLTRDAPPEQAAQSIVATGFLALSRRYATGPYELWHLTLEDAIEATGKAFLGLSLRCARCHDHKFDPVTQRDYYALYGIFASTRFPYAGSEEFVSKNFPRLHFVPTAPEPIVQEANRRLADRQRELDAEIARLEGGARKAQGTPASSDRLGALKAERERLRRLGLPPELPTAYAVTEGKPENAAVQKGGDPARPGLVVPRGVPRFEFLGMTEAPAPASGASGRRELAEWLSRGDNPLTPRVIANRIWQHHFGRGLVPTSSNFGLRGEPPSHPELLDWLAARLVGSGWSIKDLHRQILLSRTYRLSSVVDASCAAVDPGNRLLWRFERRRLDAESLRDGMLAVAGRLDLRRPGPHPFPPIEQWPWTQHHAFKAVYPSERRSVFLMTQRLLKHPFLGLWDGPDTNTSTDVRPRSTVPLQALYLMHNPFVRSQAEALAQRLEREAADDEARLKRLWELTWGRPPSVAELERALRFLDEVRAAGGTTASRPERQAWASLARLALTANEFLYVD
jgi:hypothetical protein